MGRRIWADWRDAFKEVVRLDKPTRSGAWWAHGPDGHRLLIVDTNKVTGGWLVRLADAIHEWPLWFAPDFKRWTKWVQVEKPA